MGVLVFAAYWGLWGEEVTWQSALACIWFVSPIGIALFLYATGRLSLAFLISAANMTGLVTFAAAMTGGINSFLMVWMIVIPLEAALSGSRRVVTWAIVFAVLAIASLFIVSLTETLPQTNSIPIDPQILSLIGILSAALYAGALAVSIQLFHKQSEDMIRQKEQRYRLLADNANDMITHHDSSGNITFASPACKRILGEEAGALQGNAFAMRIHEADRAGYLKALSTCAGERLPATAEFRIMKSNGLIEANGSGTQESYIWAEMRCRPAVFATLNNDSEQNSNLACDVVAVTRDISAQKAQEVEILKARDDAESASRSKTQFLANMSHELRTPLNSIIGFSNLISQEISGKPGEERRHEYMRLIHESGEHLLQVVNDILDMSKIEAGKFDIVAEPFNMVWLVQSCYQIMEYEAQDKSISLTSDIEPGLPELVADKRACKQMLINLLSNAIKFTKEGGWVKVIARKEGNAIALTVADNGIGIAPEDIPKLGDPFVQAEASYARSYEGSGLGLSVVKGLAHLQGGGMKIESDLGIGTQVTIHLPIDQSHEDAFEIELGDVVEAPGLDKLTRSRSRTH